MCGELVERGIEDIDLGVIFCDDNCQSCFWRDHGPTDFEDAPEQDE
jgi:hypothetical protein